MKSLKNCYLADHLMQLSQLKFLWNKFSPTFFHCRTDKVQYIASLLEIFCSVYKISFDSDINQSHVSWFSFMFVFLLLVNKCLVPPANTYIFTISSLSILTFCDLTINETNYTYHETFLILFDHIIFRPPMSGKLTVYASSVHFCNSAAFVFTDRNTLLAVTRGDSLKLINLRMNQVSGTLRLVFVLFLYMTSILNIKTNLWNCNADWLSMYSTVQKF